MSIDISIPIQRHALSELGLSRSEASERTHSNDEKKQMTTYVLEVGVRPLGSSNRACHWSVQYPIYVDAEHVGTMLRHVNRDIRLIVRERGDELLSIELYSRTGTETNLDSDEIGRAKL